MSPPCKVLAIEGGVIGGLYTLLWLGFPFFETRSYRITQAGLKPVILSLPSAEIKGMTTQLLSVHSVQISCKSKSALKKQSLLS
jgi:hypothetical protein